MPVIQPSILAHEFTHKSLFFSFAEGIQTKKAELMQAQEEEDEMREKPAACGQQWANITGGNECVGGISRPARHP